jgi:hypothetical protein
VVPASGLTNHSNHVRSQTSIQQDPLQGHTLSQTAHAEPRATALPTPVLWQDWVNRLQLAGQGEFDPAFSPNLYERTDDPQLTQVPGALVLVGPNTARAETFPHLGHSINYVSPLSVPSTYTLAMKSISLPSHPLDRVVLLTLPSQTTLEMPSPKSQPLTHKVQLEEYIPQGSTPDPRPNNPIHSSRHTAGAEPSTKRALSLSRGRCYDRPGKKNPADREHDPVKLHDKICKERGGSNFATDWILIVFKYGVSGDVLSRILKPQEIAAMDFKGGFEPRQVYDGFITKVGEIYECGLCKEDKKTYWKAKRNTPRHLRKFHFRLADMCDIWYAPSHRIFIQFHS